MHSLLGQRILAHSQRTGMTHRSTGDKVKKTPAAHTPLSVDIKWPTKSA